MPTSFSKTRRCLFPASFRAARAVIASAASCALFASTSPALGGDWKYMEFVLPHTYERDFVGSFDPVFDGWFEVVGPATFQVSAQGEVTGDLAGHIQFTNHGQFFFYQSLANPIPDGYGIMNRSQDVFFNTFSRDVSLAVQTPDSAQQSDFAGDWHFVALTAGTKLTKTVRDTNSGSTFTLGHDQPIAQGSQYLLDIQRSLSSLDRLSLNVAANGNAGGESLIWQGGGALSLSAVGLPLYVNASKDFAFGMHHDEEQGEQSLVVGVRAPASADASWMVGHWRVATIMIDSLSRGYFHMSTGAHRTSSVADDEKGGNFGEALDHARLNWEVEQTLVTIDQELAAEFGLSADGVFYVDGDPIYVNASGDIAITGWRDVYQDGETWALEVIVKVSDQVRPTSILTLNMEGFGGVEVVPASLPMDEGETPSGTVVYEYINGESMVLIQEAHTSGGFLGWSGDIPAGEEQSNGLLLEMNGHRNITATFETAPADSGEDIFTDTDGDGRPDVLERLFNQNPEVPDAMSPFEPATSEAGPQFGFAIRSDFELPWQVSFSYDLSPESWQPIPGEFLNFEPHAEDPSLTQVTITWRGNERNVFFRVEVEGR